MSTGSTASSGALESSDSVPHAFRDFIEERYAEWEDEFGDNVHIRRTTSFDPKN
ncbi:MAG TPA: hypothetical protein VJR50_15000 [Mycobacterium sp.]|jgi:hypothetical protein|nr:hypothetical protein [Mycobacterium sp.]